MKISGRIWAIDFLKSLADLLIVFCIGMIIDYMFSEAPSMAPAFLLMPFVILMLVRRFVKSFFWMCVIHVLVIIPMLYVPVLLRPKIIVVGLTMLLSVLSLYYRTHTDNKVTFYTLAQRLLIIAIAAVFSNGDIYRELYLITVIVTSVCFVLAMHIYNLDDSFSLISKNQQHEKGYVIMNNNRIMMGFVALIIFTGIMLPPVAEFTAGILARIPSLFKAQDMTESALPQPTLPMNMRQDQVDMSALEDIPTNGVITAILRVLLTIVLIGIGIALICMLGMMVRGIFEYFYGKKFPMDKKEVIIPEFLQTMSIRRKGKMQLKMPMNRIRRIYYKKVNEQINKGVKIQHFNTPNEIKLLIAQNEDISELTEQYKEARYGEDSH